MSVPSRSYELIQEGDRYYARVLREIRRARESILVMVYIWQNDEIGRLFVRALERKAKQKIKVVVVVDAVGSYQLPDNFFEPLRQAGAQVFMHHRIRALDWRWFRFLIRRNHRKIIIVDDKFAVTGGFNIMRECSHKYFGKKRWLDLAFASHHSDFVAQLAAQFHDAYRRASRHSWARRYLSRSKNRAILVSRNFAVSYSMSRYLKRRLRAARERIVISVPYFVPYGFYYRILKRKLKKGVSVEIILPASSDVPFVDRVSFYLARKLLLRGAKIFLYHGDSEISRFSHTKFYQIDRFAGTGSANYDYRSMVLNLDTLVFACAGSNWDSLIKSWKRSSRLACRIDLRSSWWVRLLLPLRWLL